jgi:hypothetical protein
MSDFVKKLLEPSKEIRQTISDEICKNDLQDWRREIKYYNADLNVLWALIDNFISEAEQFEARHDDAD